MLHLADILCLPAHGVAGLRAPLGLDKTGVVVPRQGETQTQPKKVLGQALFPCGREEPAHLEKHELAVLGDQFRAVSPKLLRVLEVEILGFTTPPARAG